LSRQPIFAAMAITAIDPLLVDFQRDGFCVARGLFSAEEATLIRDTFMTQNEHGPIKGLSDIRKSFTPDDPLSFYPRMMHPHRHPDKPVGPVALRFMLDGRLREVLAGVMGEEPLAVQSMFYLKTPGSRGQDFHQDNFYLKVKPGTCVAAWLAIDDCDSDNGGMMCVPETGDHEIVCPEKADTAISFTTEHVPIPEGKRAVLPILKPGDVLFFNGSTIHGSGPNMSATRFRRSLIFHYVPRSTAELSHWYQAIDFSGEPVAVKINEWGGPCGTVSPSMGAPH
jgi:hypothetical protein